MGGETKILPALGMGETYSEPDFLARSDEYEYRGRVAFCHRPHVCRKA